MSTRRHEGGSARDEVRDRRYLSACLDLAQMAEGETSPNPMVGAILVREDRILGQGYHRCAGKPHAEVEALTHAGDEARGATLYVSLEPCVHHGRTPPCVDALIEARVGEVIACMIDPDPRVNGRGFACLASAGIRVSHGLLASQALRLNEKFVRFITTGRPYVTLKAAMTLDGRIASAAGESRWITSVAAREEAHRIRYTHDAVLVGVGTLLSDDPLLTARWGRGKPLVRVIVDSHLRSPATARALSGEDGGSTLLYTLANPPDAARRALEGRSRVTVVPVPSRLGRVDLVEVIADLGRRKIMSVLVEGGGQVLGNALACGLADGIALFVAPRILGNAGIHVFSGLSLSGLPEAIPIREWSWREVGSDILIEGRMAHFPAGEIPACSPD